MNKSIKRKIPVLIAALIAFCFIVSAFAACGDEAVHEHTLFPVEGVAASCDAGGCKAYEQCLYCKKIVVDGIETTDLDSLATPVDPNHHSSLTNVAAVSGDCSVGILPAHKRCYGCGKYFTENGDPTEVENIATRAPKAHDFGDGLECSESYCKAVKILRGGTQYVLDDKNKVAITASPQGLSHTTGATTAEGKKYLDSVFANRNTIAVQMTSTSMTSTIAADGALSVVQPTTGENTSFTRFAVGDVKKEPYIGAFLMTVDVTMAKTGKIARMGAKIVDNTAQTTLGNSQLIGTNAKEENNSNRTLTANTTYRFVYYMRTTAADQLVQFFGGYADNTMTVSNLHIEYVEEDPDVNTPLAEFVWFGEAADSVFTAADCTHVKVADGKCLSCGENRS